MTQTPDRNQLALDALETVSHYLNNMGAPNDVWDAFEVAQKHAATAPKCDALVKALEDAIAKDKNCAEHRKDDPEVDEYDRGYLDGRWSIRNAVVEALATHRAQQEGKE